MSRRTVARGAAWSAPVVAVAYAAPAFAVSFVDPVGSCWRSPSGILDLFYEGPVNTHSNVAFTESTNGTCTGNAVTFPTIVRATSCATANAAVHVNPQQADLRVVEPDRLSRRTPRLLPVREPASLGARA